MTLEQTLYDKIGRKQIIAVTALICLDGRPEFQVAVALVAIAIQAVSDWRHPRDQDTVKGNQT